jgi:hypothetical protein
MKLNQNGTVNTTAVSVVLGILLIVSLIFGFWAFSGRQKYKDNNSQLISQAVSSAETQQKATDNKNFSNAEQNPLLEYVGPEEYGTIGLYYPRTWSSYVDLSGSDGNPVDGYFYPGTIPSVSDDGTYNFALRLQVNSSGYASQLQNYQGNDQVTVTAYSLPKVPSVVGVMVTGQLSIGDGIDGTLVILPLRTEALELWTEGTAYQTEFTNDILANLSFSP